MDDNKAELAIQKAGLTAPRIHPEDINKLHHSVNYVMSQPEGTTSTFCHAYLPGTNGKQFHLATGHSGCVSPENFNEQIGRDIAMSKAMILAKDKLWELEGYGLFKTLCEMDRAVDADAGD